MGDKGGKSGKCGKKERRKERTKAKGRIQEPRLKEISMENQNEGEKR